jgi:hypothetical protein
MIWSMEDTTDINATGSTTTVYFWKKSLMWNISSCAKERRKRYNQELYQLYWSPDIVRTTEAAGLRWTGQLHRMGNNDTSKRSPGSHADSIRHCFHNVKIGSHYFHTNLLARKNLHLPLYSLLPSCFTQWFFLPLAPPRNWNCDIPHNFSFYSLVVNKTISQPNPVKADTLLNGTCDGGLDWATSDIVPSKTVRAVPTVPVYFSVE